MKLHRLHVENFAAIREASIDFGPGLNVLYGPNDLGKSTLVDAIRLALLLPHASTHYEPYVTWKSGANPLVEITFETEAQRIWRVRKAFGKNGSSVLEESKDGREFDEVDRGRKVDGTLRALLGWGIPEPGGTGGSKGLPSSFLATALLSTQSDVSALLRNSLQDDPSATGREKIAAALQAIAQDPLFVALLKTTQGRRDEAFTEKGSKKTAKGTVFKVAADRLNAARDEMDRLAKIVGDSEGTEKQLRDLIEKRSHRQEALAAAVQRAAELEQLAARAAARAIASDDVRRAQEEVQRITKIGADVDAATRTIEAFDRQVTAAEDALRTSREQQVDADRALVAAEEAARAEGKDPAVTDTVVRQQLELRRSAADRAIADAHRRKETLQQAQKLVDAAAAAERDHQHQHAQADRAREASVQSASVEKSAAEALARCDLLERAVDVQSAEKHEAQAQAAVVKRTELQARSEKASAGRATLAGRRAAITVPPATALGAMRKLATELAAARGALDVGLVVTVNPTGRLKLRVRKDGAPADVRTIAKPLEIEADTDVEVNIADVAIVRVRGGRRAAQTTFQTLEERWSREVVPHLTSAEVTDLAELDGKVAQAGELDSGIRATDAEIESLKAQLVPLAGAEDTLREASARTERCRAALGDVSLESLAADITALGSDPNAGLRQKRQRLSADADKARKAATEQANTHTVAEERAKNLRAAVDAAVQTRDDALRTIPEGIAIAEATVRAALTDAVAEREKVAGELASLESTIDARKKRIEAAVSGARANAEKAGIAVDAARAKLTATIAERASQAGRLAELQRQREAEDLATAEAGLRVATERHAALPVPDRHVTDGEVAAARTGAASARSDLEAVDREVQRAHGALEQVGGAVARERLRDATDAFELARTQEREIEAEYDAWRLLLDQMREADAAQASNLGQALAPKIAERFQELTERRYENVGLTAQLGTDGVVVGGAVRSVERISVGTREQLSTLYRLAMAEYLKTAIVLDDQLVQSDDDRMEWFRKLLLEKARSFQIIVFTCRPNDYFAASSRVTKKGAVHADTPDGFLRAIDLERALGPR